MVVVLTIRCPRESGDAMFNMLGEMEHRLDIIKKFQFKKVSMTVEMIIQHDDFNELLELILCKIFLS